MTYDQVVLLLIPVMIGIGAIFTAWVGGKLYPPTRVHNLDRMLVQATSENVHVETGTGPSIGRERP